MIIWYYLTNLEILLSGGETSPWASTINGLWVLTGLVSFCLFEKVFPDQNVETKDEVNKKTTDSEVQ